MFTQTVNKSDAEVMYGNFTNAEGATITTGYALSYCVASASCDGNLAVISGTNHIFSFAGICDEDVADNAIGRYIAYGYAASVYLFAMADSLSVASGASLAGPGADASLGVGYEGYTGGCFAVAIYSSVGAVTKSTGGYVSGFVRAM